MGGFEVAGMMDSRGTDRGFSFAGWEEEGGCVVVVDEDAAPAVPWGGMVFVAVG